MLGKGSFGIVKKVYDIERIVFMAVKYVQKKKEEDLEAIFYENVILEKIQSLNRPEFLHYYGLRKDPKCKDNLILLMQSGEVSLGDLIKYNFKFTAGEALYFLDKVVDQFLILQQNGISNRDVKPDNFIILKDNDGLYSFKVSDFGTGHVDINNSKENQIEISELTGMSGEFASPEVLQIFEDNYPYDTYDPYLADVYSLGKTLEMIMMRINYLIILP